ncbi:MAG: hypothetical protein MJ195_02010 [Mycoplasmoidaceae bacterium]|nr:hypothetical protein [Mycoplasmoidaceae bacterium]
MLYLPPKANVATAISSGKLVATPNNNVLPNTSPSSQYSIHPLQALAKTIDDPDKTIIPTINRTIKSHISNFRNFDLLTFCVGGNVTFVATPLPTDPIGFSLEPAIIKNTATAYDKKINIEKKLKPCHTNGLSGLPNLEP